jgi:DNA mismatch endonuclease (patch repair protein)
MARQKVPRFDNCAPTSETASRAKRRNKAKNSRAELILRKALWHRGLRYRLHVKGLAGKPDLVFPREKVVVFIDGDFWHGRNWPELKEKLKKGSNPDYWVSKIDYNRQRDRRQAQALEKAGWHVIRVWESDVMRNTEETVQTVAAGVTHRREKLGRSM